MVGGSLAAVFIVFFSLIGVYGNMAHTLDPHNASSAVGKGYPV